MMRSDETYFIASMVLPALALVCLATKIAVFRIYQEHLSKSTSATLVIFASVLTWALLVLLISVLPSALMPEFNSPGIYGIWQRPNYKLYYWLGIAVTVAPGSAIEYFAYLPFRRKLDLHKLAVTTLVINIAAFVSTSLACLIVFLWDVVL